MADTPRRGEVWPVCCVRLLVLYRIMHVAFAALFFFAILTLWVPGYWPVSVFQAGIFALAAVAVWRPRLAPPAFVWPIVPLSFAVVWGLFQWFTGCTAYVIDTKLALLRWATFLCVFLVGITIFRDDAVRRWFRSAMLWFAFLVAALATVQTFTSKGKVFWLFDTPYTDFVMGPLTDVFGGANISVTDVFMTKPQSAQELLPLTPPVFHILLSLADEERHGYGIMQDVARQTDDALQLGPGTLYGCLKRMLAAGLVEESDERPDPTLDDERRRYYRMTTLGKRVVRAEAQRLTSAVMAARTKLAGGIS